MGRPKEYFYKILHCFCIILILIAGFITTVGTGGGGGGSSDSGSDDGNTTISSKADLVDSGSSLDQLLPNPVSWNEEFQALCMIGNSGEVGASSFYVDLYASVDEELDEDDYFIASQEVSSMSAGESNVIIIIEPDEVIEFPSIPAGNYYILYYIDSTDVIDESDENNNVGICTNGTLSVLEGNDDSTGGYNGWVQESETHTPISGATVTAGGIYDTTDDEGAFDLQNIPTGSQTLSVQATGYSDVARPITVEENTTTTTFVYMTPSENEDDDESDDAEELFNGTPVSGDSSSGDKRFFFNLDVSDQYLTITITHTSGEGMNLFVNKPSTGDYPPHDGAGRDADAVGSYGWMRVIFDAPAELGKYYILVGECDDCDGQFNIMTEYTSSEPKDPVKLNNETPLTSDTSDGDKLYYLNTGDEATCLVIETTDTVGDILDLGVNLPSTGHYPITVQNADEYSATSSGDERIVFTDSTLPSYESGTYTILVEKYGSGGLFTIEATRCLP